MIAIIKSILIEVPELKIGYTVRIDGLFGIVVAINKSANTATINFTDGSSDDQYTIDELKHTVVKFLAVMRDLNSFPVIHSDFASLISYFDTKEKVKDFVNNVKDIKAEGSLLNILTYPKIGDVAELTSLKVAEKYDFLGDRTNRIGLIDKKADNNKGKFVVKFSSKTLTLKRSEFDILNGLNSKQVFKIND
jgi:hypothetical protein